jgi:hypothetical protein
MTSRSARFVILYEKNGENMLHKVSSLQQVERCAFPRALRGGASMWRKGFSLR